MDLLRGIEKLEALPLEGRRLLLRVDLDCPVEDGCILDDRKIRSVVPTVRQVLAAGARLVLASHLGNPQGRRMPGLSMVPVGLRLAELLDQEVYLPEDVVGDGPRKVVMERMDGEVVLLENLAFHAEEEQGDDLFAQQLGHLCDLYGIDSLALCDRRWASIVALPRHVHSRGAGMALYRELSQLNRLCGSLDQPAGILLGGSQLKDRMALIQAWQGKVRTMAFGGRLGWMMAQAPSAAEREDAELARHLLARARAREMDVRLPIDLRVVLEDGTETVVGVREVPGAARIRDIGPETAQDFSRAFADLRTVWWNGTLGDPGEEPTEEGTERLARTLVRCRCASVVVGDDTAALVGRLGLTPFFTHVSAGGDAALRLLEGQDLDALKAIREGGK
ncbi:MAG TPA: phosphoglycerate kinase [Myxococcota bacterium]|nr:phosphoglycerate kinase [Myxococcota bacterium]HQK52373.1 phosphoglycerate kinase [Myxococcota bacterium]